MTGPATLTSQSTYAFGSHLGQTPSSMAPSSSTSPSLSSPESLIVYSSTSSSSSVEKRTKLAVQSRFQAFFFPTSMAALFRKRNFFIIEICKLVGEAGPGIYKCFLKKTFQEISVKEGRCIRAFSLASRIECFAKATGAQLLLYRNLTDLPFSSENVLHLDLSGSQATDTQIRDLVRQFPRVQTLDFSNSLVTNQGVESLPPTIKGMNLINCSNINDNVEFPPDLYSLYLGMGSISGKVVKRLTQSSLQKLVLRAIPNIAISELPSNLRKLEINSCDISIQHWDVLPEEIEHLKLLFCPNLDDESMKEIPATVKKLDISGCEKISNQGLEFLPKGFEELIVHGCPLITRQGILRIFSLNKYLQQVFYQPTEESFAVITRTEALQNPSNDI